MKERERERERLCLGFSCRMEVKSFCVESLCINVKIDSISATVFFSSLFLLYRFPLSLIPLTAFLLSLSLCLLRLLRLSLKIFKGLICPEFLVGRGSSFIFGAKTTSLSGRATPSHCLDAMHSCLGFDEIKNHFRLLNI